MTLDERLHRPAPAGRPSSSRATRAIGAQAVSAYTTETYNAMEVERDGVLDDADRAWNKCHGPRNYQVLRVIQDHIAKTGLRHLNVVNMSGMNEGKPDPVLFDLLCRSFDRERVSWHVVDHPQSLTFTDPHIRRWVEERGIVCIPRDHRQEHAAPAAPPADVVLCTEIIEHLDYSDTLKLLQTCRDALKPGGVLVVTTPNAMFLGYRVLFALGRWDFLHFHDEPSHVAHGLVGHTMYYDSLRLSRLLSALKFKNVQASTFNAGHGPGEYRSWMRRLAAIGLRTLSTLVPRSAQVLCVVAQRPL